MRKLSTILFAIIMLCGCMKEVPWDGSFTEQLVVDGYIEAGRGAIVTLSLNIPYGEQYDNDDFRDMVVRWAKVVVESDDEKEVLVGRTNKDYPTKYIYTGSKILGKEGKSYTLNVEYEGKRWSATTSIPHVKELSDIRIEKYCDTLYTLTATIPEMETPCAIDCALGGSSYFAPTIMGVYKADDKPRRVTINRPFDHLYRYDYMTQFHIQDTVAVKLRTMHDFGYEYRSLWENNVLNSLNPIFPAVDNLPTNISNNGLGLWIGYGSKTYVVRRGYEDDKAE